MFEAILQVIGEILLQAVVEALADSGLHALAEPFRKTPSPVVASVGYAFFGAIGCALSLLVVPSHLASHWRVVNLALTPFAVGFLMFAVGSWRAKHGFSVLRIERFAYGYLFALGMALVRFFFAK